jgi:hypothetical protein
LSQPVGFSLSFSLGEPLGFQLAVINPLTRPGADDHYQE